ncbi:MAG: class II glutamine amidotransferase, partial [Rubrivivax sp.]|nr:class II glutamine amidotransferase [Rubrivivax sp.]
IKRVEPPGLWIRQRQCAPDDPAPDDHGGVSIAKEERSVVWIASVPLTADEWRPLAEGEVVAARGGVVLSSQPLTVR